MVVKTKPCRNAAELVNPMQISDGSGNLTEYTHRCMQPHTPDHELFNLTKEGLCPFEDECPHFQSVGAA